MKKFLSLFLCVAIAVTFMPMTAFAVNETQKNEETITILHSDNLVHSNISGVEYRDDFKDRIYAAAGTIRFECRSSNEQYCLGKIEVYSGDCDYSKENALDQVKYSNLVQSFSADLTGKVTVEFTVQANQAYLLKETRSTAIKIVNEQNTVTKMFEDLQSAIDAAGENESIVIDADCIVIDKPIVIDGKKVSFRQDHSVSIEVSNQFTADSMILIQNGAVLNGGELLLNGKSTVKYGIRTVSGEQRPIIEIDNFTFKNFTEYGIFLDGADAALVYCVTDGSNGKGSVLLVSGTKPSNMTQLALIKHQFRESKPIVFDEKFNQYKPAKVWDLIIGDVEPEHTEGYDVWEKGTDGIYTEKKKSVTPSQPSGGGGGGGAVLPSATTETVKNTGTTGTDSAATSVEVKVAVSAEGQEVSNLDQKTADKLIEQAEANRSKEIIIDAETKGSKASAISVTLPGDALQKIVNKVEAGLTIQTSVAKVGLDAKALGAVAESAAGKTIELVAEKKQEQADSIYLDLQILSDGKNIASFQDGTASVTMKLNDTLAKEAAENLVGIYIDENGLFSKIGGTKNADQTFTFKTTHFSSYAIMNTTKANNTITKQQEEVRKMKLNLKSKIVPTKSKKKAVKLSWKNNNRIAFDGVEVYRSTKKNSAYAKKLVLSSQKNEGNTYINTAIKKGKRYYYKVRGYVTIDEEKVYTAYSNLAYRTIK